MLKNSKGLCVVLMMVVLLAGYGCGSHEEPTPAISGDMLKSSIVGKKWFVQKLFTRDVSGELTLEFHNDGLVSGFGGCNNLKGSYTLEGEALTFSPMASTRKSCGAALDEQEYTLQTFLQTIVRLEVVDDDELRLHSQDQGDPIVLTTGSSGWLW